MWNDQVLFDIKQILNWCCSNLSELGGKLLLNSSKKFPNGITFPNLDVQDLEFCEAAKMIQSSK